MMMVIIISMTMMKIDYDNNDHNDNGIPFQQKNDIEHMIFSGPILYHN